MRRGIFIALSAIFVLILVACSDGETTTKSADTISASLHVTRNNGQGEVGAKKVKVASGSTVYEAMNKNFKLKDTDGFITSIEGISQDESKGLYWMYEVNGEMAAKGAKELKLKNGDEVSFDLHEAK
ncbi:DUF4430 domain-containing protein [Listeria sp. ILCC797]|uniref:DUF4430 domain-containing protein n=1 Tax=Listeria sp. ILCC797 TaxID=1918333 RepID=UPI000B597751|nr:DUF4430 domain-containing protein [Listeria sp. ILCC797]